MRFSGLAEVRVFFAKNPSSEEILGLRLSEKSQAQVEDLLARNRDGGLNPAEQEVWQQYEFLEHLVRMAKAEALLELHTAE
jgi:hypothetical protein